MTNNIKIENNTEDTGAKADVEEIIKISKVDECKDIKTNEYINLMLTVINNYSGKMPEILIGLMFKTLSQICINDVVDSFASISSHYTSTTNLLQDIYYNSCLYFIHATNSIYERLYEEFDPKRNMNISFRGFENTFNYISKEYNDLEASIAADIVIIPYLMNEIEVDVNGTTIYIGKEAISYISNYSYLCYAKFLVNMKEKESEKKNENKEEGEKSES